MVFTIISQLCSLEEMSGYREETVVEVKVKLRATMR